MGRRSCRAQVDAVARLLFLSLRKITEGSTSNPRGGTLSVPETKARMSSIVHGTSPSMKC